MNEKKEEKRENETYIWAACRSPNKKDRTPYHYFSFHLVPCSFLFSFSFLFLFLFFFFFFFFFFFSFSFSFFFFFRFGRRMSITEQDKESGMPYDYFILLPFSLSLFWREHEPTKERKAKGYTHARTHARTLARSHARTLAPTLAWTHACIHACTHTHTEQRERERERERERFTRILTLYIPNVCSVWCVCVCERGL